MWAVLPCGACLINHGSRGPRTGSYGSTSDAAPTPNLPSGAQVSGDCGVLEEDPSIDFAISRKVMDLEDDRRPRSASKLARTCIMCHGAVPAEHFSPLPHRQGRGARGGGGSDRSKRHGWWRYRTSLSEPRQLRGRRRWRAHAAAATRARGVEHGKKAPIGSPLTPWWAKLGKWCGHRATK